MPIHSTPIHNDARAADSSPAKGAKRERAAKDRYWRVGLAAKNARQLPSRDAVEFNARQASVDRSAVVQQAP